MKIFVTVGSMLPFDRLVRAMDDWAARHPEVEVFAQIGAAAFLPSHFAYQAYVTPRQFYEYSAASNLVISHAGMGTIITALEHRRPMVLMPRRQELGEVTSNHQLATARWLAGRAGIRVVESEHQLDEVLSDKTPLQSGENIDSGTKTALIHALREFISQ